MASKPKAKRAKRKPNDAGVLPGNYPKDRAWAVDYDYVKKLPPAAKQWLAEFSDRYYGGDFRGTNYTKWSKANRRDVNRDKNAGRDDVARDWVMPTTNGRDQMPQDSLYKTTADVGTLDQSPTPAYLNDPLYKEVRDGFRQHLTKSRRPLPPDETPQYQRAKRKLDKLAVYEKDLADDTQVERWRSATRAARKRTKD